MIGINLFATYLQNTGEDRAAVAILLFVSFSLYFYLNSLNNAVVDIPTWLVSATERDQGACQKNLDRDEEIF